MRAMPKLTISAALALVLAPGCSAGGPPSLAGDAPASLAAVAARESAGTPGQATYLDFGAAATSVDLKYPGALTVDPDGNIWVATSKKVYKFDPAGNHVGELQGTFSYPAGLVATAGRLYVLNTLADVVQYFDPKSLLQLGAFGGYGSAPGKLNKPFGLAAGGETLYVADSKNHRIQAFTKDGALIKAVGSYGKTGDNKFNWPMAICVANGKLLVASRERFMLAGLANLSFSEYKIGGLFVPGIEFPVDALEYEAGDDVLASNWRGVFSISIKEKLQAPRPLAGIGSLSGDYVSDIHLARRDATHPYLGAGQDIYLVMSKSIKAIRTVQFP